MEKLFSSHLTEIFVMTFLMVKCVIHVIGVFLLPNQRKHRCRTKTSKPTQARAALSHVLSRMSFGVLDKHKPVACSFYINNTALLERE